MADLHITVKHSGKMEGMYSISTPCTINPRCAINAQIPGSVCEKCYARKLLGFRPSVKNCLERNYKILTSEVIPVDDMPHINYAFFRIESFGDLGNTTHAINYLSLIKRNPYVNFGWWTKSPDFVAEAFDKTGYEKPANLQIIRSSMYIDKPVKNKYWFVDKTFTVYSKQAVKEGKVVINCQKTPDKKCINCLKCYLPNDIKEICEEIK